MSEDTNYSANVDVETFKVNLKAMFAHSNFTSFNLHLSRTEMHELANNYIFPQLKPVFSPYAATKNKAAYTQVRINGTKHYVHRVALHCFQGPPPNESSTEASHRVVNCPMDITRDFNPNTICWETGEENRARLACKIAYRSVHEATGRYELAVEQASKVCALVHPAKPCIFWNPVWKNSDHNR